MRATAIRASTLYFVRHGESRANVDGVIAGWRDSPLTASGERQASDAAARLSGLRIERVYSSPLRRAADTAGVIARASGTRVELVDALRERSFGVLEGKPSGVIGNHFDARPAGGECWQQFAARVGGALARLPRDGVIVVVAHAGVYRVLLERLGGQRFNGRPPNAGVFVVDEAATPSCRALEPA